MPTYYDVDLRNAALREFAFGTPWYGMPLVALFKFCRLPIPCSTDDPPVEALAPFETDLAALPDDLREQFAALGEELTRLGFRGALFHSIPDPLHTTRNYWATFLHPTGRAWARIHCRIWTLEGKVRTHLFPMFFTESDDGSVLITSAGKPDMLMPEGVRMVNVVGAGCEALWERHREEGNQDLHYRPRRIGSADELRAATERLHARIRDYLLERRIFQPLSEAEQQRLQGEPGAAGPAEPGDAEEAAVLLELDRLQTKRTSWWYTLLILAVSILLFMGAWNVGPREWLWMFIPILFFHELGHYLAMRLFGYRNLRMFFIPFLGAAVAGKHYNVAGWKKALVALAGPVPGIAVGAGLGFAGLFLDKPWLIQTALFMEIINGFNLLPLLPLDGGWVVHAVLFVRHPLLDVVFRLMAILALAGLALLAGDKVMLVLPGVLLLGLPMAWRVARIAHRLREQGLVAVSPDAQSIPPEAAWPILHELRGAMPKVRTPKLLAQSVASVFETLNARPPGVFGSLALLAVQGGGFLAAFVLALIFTFFTHFDPKDVELPPETEPAHNYERGTTAEWHGVDAPWLWLDSRVTLIATYPDAETAQAHFLALTREAPAEASLRYFGQSVLLTLPLDDAEQSKRWQEVLEQAATQVVVDRPQLPASLRLACQLPEGAAGDELEADLRGYLMVPNCELLIPPWSPAWEVLPANDLERFRKARRTLRRLENLSFEAAQQPAIRALERPRFRLRGDWFARMQEISQAMQAEKQRLLEEIRAEGEATVDQGVLALWEARERGVGEAKAGGAGKDPNAWHREWEALMRRMAERMGPLPLDGQRPRPGCDADAARGGNATRRDQTLTCYLSFHHPHEGLPALAERLYQRGGARVKYEFFPMQDEDE